MRRFLILALVVAVASLTALPGGIASPQETDEEQLDLAEANVMSVNYSQLEAEREYRFNITLYHDDDGEEGYANWWQVETLEGEQLGRRDLLHAHGTKKFTRSETITVPEGTRYVVVRGHDQTHEYGGRAAIINLDSEKVGFLDQESEPNDFTDYAEPQTVEMKSYSNEEFGFKISYPKSWEKNLPKEEEEREPREYREIFFRASSSDDPAASIFVIVNEVNQPGTLEEYEEFLELRNKLLPQAGYEEIYRGELAGLPAVITEITQVNYELKQEAKNGMEKTWDKSTWEYKRVGLITNGYLYRITVGALSEDFKEANNKYLKRILDSFEILPE